MGKGSIAFLEKYHLDRKKQMLMFLMALLMLLGILALIFAFLMMSSEKTGGKTLKNGNSSSLTDSSSPENKKESSGTSTENSGDSDDNFAQSDGSGSGSSSGGKGNTSSGTASALPSGPKEEAVIPQILSLTGPMSAPSKAQFIGAGQMIVKQVHQASDRDDSVMNILYIDSISANIRFFAELENSTLLDEKTDFGTPTVVRNGNFIVKTYKNAQYEIVEEVYMSSDMPVCYIRWSVQNMTGVKIRRLIFQVKSNVPNFTWDSKNKCFLASRGNRNDAAIVVGSIYSPESSNISDKGVLNFDGAGALVNTFIIAGGNNPAVAKTNLSSARSRYDTEYKLRVASNPLTMGRGLPATDDSVLNTMFKNGLENTQYAQDAETGAIIVLGYGYRHSWVSDGAWVARGFVETGRYTEVKRYFYFLRQQWLDNDMITVSINGKNGRFFRGAYCLEYKGKCQMCTDNGWQSTCRVEGDMAMYMTMLRYYELTKDESFKTDFFPMIQENLNFLLNYQSSSLGLIAAPQKAHEYLDWAQYAGQFWCWDNSMEYRALTEAAAYCREVGLSEQASKWQTAADKIRNNMYRFWNASGNYYYLFLQANGQPGGKDNDKLPEFQGMGPALFGADNNAERMAVSMDVIRQALLNNSGCYHITLRLDKKSHFFCNLFANMYYDRVGRNDVVSADMELAKRYTEPNNGWLPEGWSNTGGVGYSDLPWTNGNFLVLLNNSRVYRPAGVTSDFSANSHSYFSVSNEGTYQLSFRYTTTGSDTTAQVVVDGVEADTLHFSGIIKGGASEYTHSTVIRLSAGNHSVKVNGSGFTLTKLNVLPVTSLEAESAASVGGTQSTGRTNYTGSGFITLPFAVGNKVTFTFSAGKSDNYELMFRYFANAESSRSVYIDGVFYGKVTLPRTAGQSWNTVSVYRYLNIAPYLTAGSHTVALIGESGDTGTIGLDSLLICEATV